MRQRRGGEGGEKKQALRAAPRVEEGREKERKEREREREMKPRWGGLREEIGGESHRERSGSGAVRSGTSQISSRSRSRAGIRRGREIVKPPSSSQSIQVEFRIELNWMN